VEEANTLRRAVTELREVVRFLRQDKEVSHHYRNAYCSNAYFIHCNLSNNRPSSMHTVTKYTTLLCRSVAAAHSKSAIVVYRCCGVSIFDSSSYSAAIQHGMHMLASTVLDAENTHLCNLRYICLQLYWVCNFILLKVPVALSLWLGHCTSSVLWSYQSCPKQRRTCSFSIC
jgi:hypothetical protein